MKIHRSPFLGPTRGCRIPTLAVGLLLLLVTSGATAQQGATAPDERWITIGADAFDALVRNPTFQFGSLPLQKEAQRDAVVLTRVHDSDIVAISQRIHERLNRCAGFMRHSSLEEAWEALEAATAPPADRLEADYIIDQPLLVADMKLLLSEAPILETIGHLSQDFNNRFYAHPSGAAAAQWIYDLWEGYAGDRTDVMVELFDHPWAQSSVILTIQGSLYPDEVVILGGHLDSIASGSSNPSFLAPGADDNASGIAALSEVLRAAMALGFQPQKTVQFMGYSAEEVGLYGSQEIANAYEAAGVDVVAVLQMDMTAYYGSAEDIALITDFTNSTLTSFLGELLDTYQPELIWTTSLCGYGCSDHASWNAQCAYPQSSTTDRQI